MEGKIKGDHEPSEFTCSWDIFMHGCCLPAVFSYMLNYSDKLVFLHGNLIRSADGSRESFARKMIPTITNHVLHGFKQLAERRDR